MAAIFPDVELWATGKIRAALSARTGGRVSNSYVGDRDWEVTVRRDGGPTLDQVREAPRLGVNVYVRTPVAGKTLEQDATDLALLVSAILRGAADGTVSRVRQTSGPSPVADAMARRYMTFALVSRGVPLP